MIAFTFKHAVLIICYIKMKMIISYGNSYFYVINSYFISSYKGYLQVPFAREGDSCGRYFSCCVCLVIIENNYLIITLIKIIMLHVVYCGLVHFFVVKTMEWLCLVSFSSTFKFLVSSASLKKK